MARRRRRKKRRSATRNTASLLALALPAPLQRLANSPVGPLLMFFGLPAMLVAGLLQVDWQNGAPHLKVNQDKASQLGQAVHDRLENLPNHATLEHWQQSARDTWNSHVQNAPQQNDPGYSGQPYPTASGEYPASNSPSGWPAESGLPHRTSTSPNGWAPPPARAPFPSTKPPSYVSTDGNRLPAARQAWGEQTQQAWAQQQPQYQQPQYQQPQYQQPQYQQPQYQQPQYQQPQYQQPQYQQPQYPAQLPWQTR